MHKPPHANDLILNLKTGIAHYESVDFNRFRYFGAPKKRAISKATYSNRDPQVYRWYRCFSR